MPELAARVFAINPDVSRRVAPMALVRGSPTAGNPAASPVTLRFDPRTDQIPRNLLEAEFGIWRHGVCDTAGNSRSRANDQPFTHHR